MESPLDRLSMTAPLDALTPVRARIQDVPQIHRIVKVFSDRGEMLPRPMNEVYEHLRDYLVVRDGDRVLGCAALHILWQNLAEVRSVAVAEEVHQRGLGTVLVRACIQEAVELGISTVFCLTYKPDYFARFGFRRVDVIDLPRKVWGECTRCPKFAHCDEIAMTMSLKHLLTPRE